MEGHRQSVPLNLQAETCPLESRSLSSGEPGCHTETQCSCHPPGLLRLTRSARLTPGGPLTNTCDALCSTPETPQLCPGRGLCHFNHWHGGDATRPCGLGPPPTPGPQPRLCPRSLAMSFPVVFGDCSQPSPLPPASAGPTVFMLSGRLLYSVIQRR